MESADDIFLQAREITDVAARTAYLANACGQDHELRDRVEIMLRDADAAQEFFGRTEVPAKEASEGPGAVIGRYKLLEKIGEGGMGVVYMAQQREPVVRKVALKIIKAGMDTRQVIARFEAERQALALMDDPNIAKVLDGGATEAGRPYFVMDLVQGLPITQFCDEAKLSTRERLELFLDVCSAIQHAHQKGIIHRDIKPSNILVTLHGDKPVPKVIDFGIAKATQQPLTDKTLFTQFQNFIGTPAYMSPEQASLSGLDIDTRSDIYGLGVLLYELLTGTTPFDGKELLKSGLDEMRRTICEKEPPRPSTRLRAFADDELTTAAKKRCIEGPQLIIALRGDLDWIVMKCLEKDRARRYDTAGSLGADIRRHLGNEAVLARPQSATYRFRKWARRNSVTFAAGTAVLIALLLGLGASTAMLVRARKAEREQGWLLQKANAAEKARTEELWRSYLARAQAERRSGVPAQRFATMEAISNAVAIRPSLELRNEAIAMLALTDIGNPSFGEDTAWAGNHPQELPTVFDSELKRVALFAQDGSIHVRRVSDGFELVAIPAGDSSEIGPPDLLLFSPDDRYLAARSGKGLVRCWQLAPLQLRLDVRVEADRSGSFAFSADSQWLFCGTSTKQLHGYQLANATHSTVPNVRKPDATLNLSMRAGAVSFDRANTRLAIGEGRDVQVWQWPQRRHLHTFVETNHVRALAWHPDGRRLFVGTRDGEIHTWDTAVGTFRGLHGHQSQVTHLALHPRGDVLASHSWDGTSKLWDIALDSPLLTTEGGMALRCRADGRQLGFRHTTHRYGTWPLAVSRVFRTLPAATPTSLRGGVNFSPDGRWLVWAEENTLCWADLQTGHCGQRASPGLAHVRFDSDGRGLVLACEDGLKQWSMPESLSGGSATLLFTGMPEWIGTNHFPLSWRLDVPAARNVALAIERWPPPENPRVIINNAPGQARVLASPVRSPLVNASLSPDHRWLALGLQKAAAHVLDAHTGEVIRKWPEVQSAFTSFTPDGEWLITGTGKEYQFWKAGTWQPGRSIQRGSAANAAGIMAFSGDGRLLALIKGTQTISLMDWRSGEPVADLIPPRPESLRGFAFSPDGSQLAAAAKTTIQLWDLRELRRELTALKLDWNAPPYPPSTNSVADVVFRLAPDPAN